MRYFVTGYSFLVLDRYGKEAMGLRNLGIVNLGIEGLHFGYLLGSGEQAVGISNFRHFSSL